MQINKRNVNFLKIVIWITIFIVILNSITYIFRPNSDMKQRFAGFYYEKNNSIDVIYIGSSPVHPYWAAPLAWNKYGFTSWPLATNIQQPRAAPILLQEALKTQNPKVVIFELRMFTAPQLAFEDGQEPFIRNLTDNLKQSINRKKMIDTLVDESLNKIPYFFDIIKYHGTWKYFKLSDLRYWNFERRDNNCGHLIVGEVLDLSKEWHNFSTIHTTVPIPPEQEIVLRDLLQYCKKHDIEALFTVNPFTELTELTQQQFNYMERIVEDEYEYTFLNFNSLYGEVGIDFREDFYNSGHMNAKGAEKFTSFLSKYLVDHYNLSDKRIEENEKQRDNEKICESWNERYEMWNEKSKAAIEKINQIIKEETDNE